MGGSFSEPATLLDLGEDVFRLYTEHRPTITRTGWSYGNYSMSEIIQGVQHVDDAIIMSCIWCSDCLLEGVQKLWSDDVGTTLEETGNNITFLHSQLRFV